MARNPVATDWQKAATGIRQLRDMTVVSAFVVFPVVAAVFFASKKLGAVAFAIAAVALLWVQFSATNRWRALPLSGLAKWAATAAWIGANVSCVVGAFALVVTFAAVPPSMHTALKLASITAGGLISSGLVVSIFMVGLHLRQPGIVIGVLLYAGFIGVGAILAAGGIQAIADSLRVAFPLFLVQLILFGHVLDVLTAGSPAADIVPAVRATAGDA